MFLNVSLSSPMPMSVSETGMDKLLAQCFLFLKTCLSDVSDGPPAHIPGLARWRAYGCVTAALVPTGDSLSTPHGGRAVRLRRHILGGETACCCMCVTLGILTQ